MHNNETGMNRPVTQPIGKTLHRSKQSPFASTPALNATERQLLENQGLLSDDLGMLNTHLINKACEQLATHNPVAAMIARLAPWMQHGPDQRDLLTAAEILAVLSEVDRNEHLGALTIEGIESACRGTLGLPEVTWNGVVYTDLSVIWASEEVKTQHQEALLNIREEVLGVVIYRLDGLAKLLGVSSLSELRTTSDTVNSVPSYKGLSHAERDLLSKRDIDNQLIDALNEYMLGQPSNELPENDGTAALIESESRTLIDMVDGRDVLPASEIHDLLKEVRAEEGLLVPSIETIERACRETLGLPEVRWDGVPHFDLGSIRSSKVEMGEMQKALHAVRKPVLEVIIRRHWAMEELLGGSPTTESEA